MTEIRVNPNDRTINSQGGGYASDGFSSRNDVPDRALEALRFSRKTRIPSLFGLFRTI